MLAESTTDSGLIHAMWHRFATELPAITALATRHRETFFARGLTAAGGSTSSEDCLLLYLMIRQFERRMGFEIGTYIGTTAVCMNEALRRNGGVLTTSDPIDYAALPPWSGIRFMRRRRRARAPCPRWRGAHRRFLLHRLDPGRRGAAADARRLCGRLHRGSA